MRYSLYFSLLIVGLSLCLILPASFIYYTDPYQIFHKTKFPGIGLTNNQRYHDAGLINSFLADPSEGYDSVLVGSSLSENFTTEAAHQLLNWHRPLRLFLSGGNPKELSIIVHHSLHQQNTKHLLWELRPRLYWSPVNDFVIDKHVFPDYLYNNNPFDDFPYLLNIDVLEKSWSAWSGNKAQFAFTPETIGYWGDNGPFIAEWHNRFNAPENLLAFRQQAKSIQKIDQLPTGEIPYPVIKDTLFPIINQYCNTDVELVLFIPPVSKIDYIGGGDFTIRAIRMARYILNETQYCKNIRLHAFDLMEFSNDLNNYKDQEHYLPPINVKILELIGKHENILTLQNIDEYEAGLIKALNEYQVYSSYSSTNPL